MSLNKAQSSSHGVPSALWNMPALPPPPGKIPDFDHPENKDAEIIAMNSVFLALMLIAVAIRFCNTKPQERRFTWDKALCIIAVIGSISHSVLMLTSLHIGYGKHLWEIRAITLTREKLLTMNQFSTAYIIAVGFAKLSVLALFLRFFGVMTTSRVLIWFGIGFNIVSSLVFLGIVIYQAIRCIRLDTFSTPSFCTEMPRIVVAQAAVNVFLDFYILVIPLQEVLKLNLNLRKKLGVLALFGIGSSACVVSVVRVAFSIKHMEEKDLFWSAVLTSELSIVEMNVLIIAPSLLFLPAFIKTSKTGLNSFRLKVLSRSRLDGPQQSSLHYKKDGIAVQIKHQPSQELDFITEPVDHGAQTKRSAKQGDNDWKRESDVYSPV